MSGPGRTKGPLRAGRLKADDRSGMGAKARSGSGGAAARTREGACGHAGQEDGKQNSHAYPEEGLDDTGQRTGPVEMEHGALTREAFRGIFGGKEETQPGSQGPGDRVGRAVCTGWPVIVQGGTGRMCGPRPGRYGHQSGLAINFNRFVLTLGRLIDGAHD